MLAIDETGDCKDGKATDHVGYQYLGSIGRIANRIVSVSSVWADEKVYHPLDVEPYTPAKRLELPLPVKRRVTLSDHCLFYCRRAR